MIGSTDMSTPVTRGELRAELQDFEIRLEQRLATLATRADLELWGGALLAHMKSLERRLLEELARHTKAICESMSAQIAIVDEQYADLPGRVSRLETEVFPRRQR